MRLVAKTLNKVIIEVTETEIKNKTFDFIWDRIRKVYHREKFDIFSIYSVENNEFNFPVEKIIFIELTCNNEIQEKLLV